MTVEKLQHEWEFDQLLNLAAGAEKVLEIGVWQGGTLYGWVDRIKAQVVAVDLDITDNARRLFAHKATLIEGNSAAPEIIAQVSEFGPYDVVFVDADHSLAAASQDWANYSPMVKPGGLFAFHDIRPTEHATLNTLWDDIKRSGKPTTEFNEHLADWGGIGVVHF